jgi:hypothetical protein
MKLSPSCKIQCPALAALPHRPEHGTAERWQHGARVLELTEQAGVLTARVLAEHGLDRLVLAGQLAPLAGVAGMRLRADYQAAHLATRVIASYSATRGVRQGGYTEYERSDAEEAAYRRWREAVRAVGIIDSGVVLAACCEDRLPVPTALPALQRGLARLIRWYRL